MNLMTDKLLLWPLLFDGKLHYAGHDPLELAIDATALNSRGASWWGTNSGDGHAIKEPEQKWIHELWRKQETL